MASIVFNDGTAVTLSPFGAATALAPASRLRGWRPVSTPIMDVAVRLGSGARDVFEFREARRVEFTMEHILNDDLLTLERYRLHMLRGGVCTVNTTDLGSRSYSDMALVETTEPEISPPDPQTLDYSVTQTLEYVGTATTVTMLCIYT